MNLTNMNKINIIQLVPKRACDYSVDTCAYCKYEAPHPSPIPSDWLSEDWDGEKAKVREQRSLIDLNFPKVDQRPDDRLRVTKGTTDSKFKHTGRQERRRKIARDYRHIGTTIRSGSSDTR